MSGKEKAVTILYIDDDETNRKLLGFIIERRPSWSMIEAGNGKTGIAKAIEIDPQVILLDISLPDMDGTTVLSHLKKDTRTASIPVIAITGKTGPADVARGLRQGFSRYLKKPVELDEVYRAIDEVLY